MANFNVTVTDAGLALLAQAMAGKTLNFTSVKMGSGTFSGTAGSATDLVKTELTLDINKIFREESQVTVKAIMEYGSVETGFTWSEVGLFASDPSGGNDILYAYGYASSGDYIPGKSEATLTEKVIRVTIAVGTAESVTASISSSVYVDKSDFDKQMDEIISVVNLTHKKSGSTHIFTGLGSKTGLVPAQFKSTAAYTEGDGATIDGVSYTIQLTGADDPETDLFVSGKSILVDIDTDGKTINFKAGGGLTKAKLSLATATEDKVFNGYTFYSGDKSLKTGKALNTVTTVDASNLFNGKKAYTNNGVLITGSALSTTTTVNASNLFSGKKAYTNTGKLITGTALSVTTDVSASNLFSGKKAYTNSGTLITGTALSETTTASANNIMNGYTAYDNLGNLMKGSLIAYKVASGQMRSADISVSSNSYSGTITFTLPYVPTFGMLGLNDDFTEYAEYALDCQNCYPIINGAIPQSRKHLGNGGFGLAKLSGRTLTIDYNYTGYSGTTCITLVYYIFY